MLRTDKRSVGALKNRRLGSAARRSDETINFRARTLVCPTREMILLCREESLYAVTAENIRENREKFLRYYVIRTKYPLLHKRDGN